MDYKDLVEKARKDGVEVVSSVAIHKWNEKGEQVVGMVLDIVPFDKGKFDTPVNQYIIETDKGKVSTVLGSATDKQLEGKAVKGMLIVITFQGKNELDGGRQVNSFSVDLIDPDKIKD